jgi:ABC-type branched-subunit amino acid transport system substrate-binding protein
MGEARMVDDDRSQGGLAQELERLSPLSAAGYLRDELEKLMRERRYEDALELLQGARSKSPTSPELARAIDLLTQRLMRRYGKMLGSLERVPRLLVGPQLSAHRPSNGERDLLGLVDGTRTFGAIVDASPLDRFETYKSLTRLVEAGFLAVGAGVDTKTATAISTSLPPVQARARPMLWLRTLLAAGLAPAAIVTFLVLKPDHDGPATSLPTTFDSPVAATAPVVAAAPIALPELRFGMAAALSGPTRELGRQMKIGVEAAWDTVNDAGGVNGRPLRLVAIDDGYEPARTADAMKALTEKEHVAGIIGNVGTPTAVVALPFALEKKMLFFGAFTGASLLRREPPDRYVFNFRASYAEETAAVVGYLVKVRHLRPEQIAVFAQEDAYGDSGFAGVAKAVRALGGDSAKILRLGYKRNTVDVAAAAARLREHAGAIKAVVMVPTYRAAAKLVEKVRAASPNMIFTCVSFAGPTELAEELALLGPSYATGVIVTQVVPPVDGYSTLVLRYKAALARYFPGERPDAVSLEGYVDGMLLADAVRRAGGRLDTEHLVDVLESMRGVDLGLGEPLGFGPNDHQASHRVWGLELDSHGKYQPVDLD